MTAIYRLSSWRGALVLVAANLIPLLGYALQQWDYFAVIFVYWLETAIVALFTLLKVLLAGAASQRVSAMPRFLGKLSTLPIFLFAVPGFMVVHFVFLVIFLGPEDPVLRGNLLNLKTEALWEFLSAQEGLMLAVLGLVASHGYYFVRDYLAGGAYRSARYDRLPDQVIMRVVVMHLTILVSGALLLYLVPAAMVVLLVVMKILVEVGTRETRSAPPAAGA